MLNLTFSQMYSGLFSSTAHINKDHVGRFIKWRNISFRIPGRVSEEGRHVPYTDDTKNFLSNFFQSPRWPYNLCPACFPRAIQFTSRFTSLLLLRCILSHFIQTLPVSAQTHSPWNLNELCLLGICQHHHGGRWVAPGGPVTPFSSLFQANCLLCVAYNCKRRSKFCFSGPNDPHVSVVAGPARPPQIIVRSRLKNQRRDVLLFVEEKTLTSQCWCGRRTHLTNLSISMWNPPKMQHVCQGFGPALWHQTDQQEWIFGCIVQFSETRKFHRVVYILQMHVCVTTHAEPNLAQAPSGKSYQAWQISLEYSGAREHFHFWYEFPGVKSCHLAFLCISILENVSGKVKNWPDIVPQNFLAENTRPLKPSHWWPSSGIWKAFWDLGDFSQFSRFPTLTHHWGSHWCGVHPTQVATVVPAQFRSVAWSSFSPKIRPQIVHGLLPCGGRKAFKVFFRFSNCFSPVRITKTGLYETRPNQIYSQSVVCCCAQVVQDCCVILTNRNCAWLRAIWPPSSWLGNLVEDTCKRSHKNQLQTKTKSSFTSKSSSKVKCFHAK